MAEILTTATDFYRYYFESFQIIIAGREPIEMRGLNINTFDIERDYDNDFFTILHVNLNLDAETYYAIMDNKLTTEFRIRLIKYVHDPNNPDNKTNISNSFNDKFIMFPTENDAFLSKDLYKVTVDTKGENDRSTYLKTNFDFYLFRAKDVLKTKEIVNTVITSATMTDVLGFLLSKASANYVRMTPLDNKKVYNEIILRPVSILENIVYLNQQYGFYNHGMLLFFDYYYTYLIDKRAECTSFKKNEYKEVIIIINKTSNPNSLTPGMYADAEKRCYFVHATQESISLETSAIAEDQTVGNVYNVINAGSGSTTKVTPKVQQIGSGTNRALVNTTDNIYATKELEYRKIENDYIVRIGLVDYDVNTFAPNKKYTLKFEDNAIQKTHGGAYRICKGVHSFTKQGDQYSAKGYIVLKRVP